MAKRSGMYKHDKRQKELKRKKKKEEKRLKRQKNNEAASHPQERPEHAGEEQKPGSAESE
jgi:hypothetical protein